MRYQTMMMAKIYSGLAMAALLAATPLSVSAQAQDAAAAKEAPGPQRARQAPRKDRVFAKDLEGVWVSSGYLDALKQTRMPLEAARKSAPIVISIKRENRSYPMVRTDFNEAVLLRVIDIQPDGRKNGFRVVLAEDDMRPVSSDEVTYVHFRGQKGPDGRFGTLSIAEPHFGKKKYRDFVRLEEGLGPTVNGIVLAGSYQDAEGRPYAFSADGQAKTPDGDFAYEIRLASAGAKCNVIETPGDERNAPEPRAGFRWKAGKLELLDVSADPQGVLTCAAAPRATLSRAD